ncbi:hypothetical protein ACG0Z6_12065 [Roseateles sp. BYS180W]|uniref:Uncharacterized protein n=1 Tax=Roseateles rivi TaxID=3299028 RepID=A0ABW7FXE2_9BURK
MTTDVWVVACKQPPNLTGATLLAQCPVAQRISVQTTAQFFEQKASAPEMGELDPAMVGSAFSVAFAVVVLFYLVARGAGSVLSLIRRG